MSASSFAALIFLVAVPIGTAAGTLIGVLTYWAMTGDWILW